MPPHGEEVQLTTVEINLMAVFVKHKLFSDKQDAVILRQLADKLEGKYAKTNSN